MSLESFVIVHIDKVFCIQISHLVQNSSQFLFFYCNGFIFPSLEFFLITFNLRPFFTSHILHFLLKLFSFCYLHEISFLSSKIKFYCKFECLNKIYWPYQESHFRNFFSELFFPRKLKPYCNPRL